MFAAVFSDETAIPNWFGIVFFQNNDVTATVLGAHTQ